MSFRSDVRFTLGRSFISLLLLLFVLHVQHFAGTFLILFSTSSRHFISVLLLSALSPWLLGIPLGIRVFTLCSVGLVFS